MHRFFRSLIVATALLALAVSPAAAITYGEPDDGAHPYVGFLIIYDPAEDGWFSCSGTLLDADTFLTAAHCVWGVGTEGELEGPSGGTDAWVTFDETEVLAGWPLRSEVPDVYPDQAALNAARRAWLEANSDFVRGTAFPNPDYDNFADFPTNHDVGIVELDDDVNMNTYGVLADLGTVEELLASAGKKNDAIVETVGYGIQSIAPHPMDVESRYKSTSRIVESKGKASKSGNLHTSNNPSPIGGRGGSCFGDSGGPVLVNDTNEVIAVVSYGFSLTCHGADYSWRVDTQDSYDFVEQFLSE